VPLAGVVVSYCLSFAVVLFLLGGWALGRPPTTVEVLTVAVLLLLTFVRTLVWARDGARLTRQVLRTEAFFRSLVHRAADITIVLDAAGAITWASGAGQSPTAWSARDLEGRTLESFVHPADRHELLRALGRTADLDDGPAPVFRLRTRDGGWRRLETVRTASSAGLPGRGIDHDGTVLHLRDVVERRNAELELERMAYTDFLTGLPNRARLMAALETARARASRRGEFCVLMLDLDGFKPVNDIAGHDVGDDLLVQVAERLRRTVRDRDLISRLGGDEFAVLIRAGLDEATVLAERIVAELRDMHPSAPADGLVLEVSGSVGVTEFDPAEDVATTMRQADLALRAAKTAGKGCVRLHADTADDAPGRRARLARDLPRAIEDGQLRLVFQPVVGVEERRVLGLEALVRWQHPQLGTVPPDEFISLAEADGLIVPLERWVLGAATAALAPLLAEGRDLRLGVNVSVRHLQAGCLAPDVARALADSGVPPQRLMVEITESVLMADEEGMAGDLSTLREMGCVLSLDDFGKGYSSLARLARLPVDILKMDREFVGHIDRDPRSTAIVGSVIELGRTLGMDVVAEGVETPEQLAALHGLGCRYLQGYLLGRPVPAEELRALLDGFDPRLLDEAADLTDSALAVH
jgi:diguanylate cyclase (GGDEF)-like protein/PAS domain S-box-containing protein